MMDSIGNSKSDHLGQYFCWMERETATVRGAAKSRLRGRRAEAGEPIDDAPDVGVRV